MKNITPNKKKILVFSDSHGHFNTMLTTTQTQQPDIIIHLGDGYKDAMDLKYIMPDTEIISVLGNCDYSHDGLTEMVFDIEGVRFFITHGHNYGVKNGINRFVSAARANEAQLALFGHTHIPLYRELHGTSILNPGSIGYYGEFAVIILENGKVMCYSNRA